MSFKLPQKEIEKLLQKSPTTSWRSILDSASPEHPLDLEQCAVILNHFSNDPSILPLLRERANKVKQEVFGSSVKIFIPLYLSNVCQNDCLYCSYRKSHTAMPRRTLSEEEFGAEVAHVISMGYRVLEIVTSECPEFKRQGKLASYIKTAKELLNSSPEPSSGEIILMPWALSTEEFEGLKEAGCDAFYLWQETYQIDKYSLLHPKGTPKSDFQWRVEVFDRAIQSGFKRVGLGILFGLGKWNFDVLALIAHGKYLEQTYKVSPDALGIPRFKPAEGASIKEALHPVSDDELKAAVALYRLAFPHSHVFLNTREKLPLIFELLEGGGSEMNIACAIFPGAYTHPAKERQFDHYSYPTDKVISMLLEKGYKPIHFVRPKEALLR